MIREMTAADMEAIEAMEREYFTDAWTRSAWEEELENPRSVTFVEEEGGQIRGYLNLWAVLDEGQINRFAVASSHRRTGIGSRLLARAEEFAQEKGLYSLTLEVRLSNEAAQAAYKKAGFLEMGIRPGFYANPEEDALIMTRTRSEVHYL